ncbi:MAG: glycosyltransferase family protein [Nanoarchaeota archaeon]|nr:glycosyltransferase family protein [Nanoarchaeota archaeon]
MKILFIVSGIGFGDATREHANILAVKKKFPKAKIMVAGYDNSYLYFKDKFDTIQIQGYKLPGKEMKINALHFGLINIFLPAFWFIGTLKVRLEAFNFIPDIIVSDFEPVGMSLAKILNKKCIVVFGFDPSLYEEYLKQHKVNLKMKVEAKYFSKLYDQAYHTIIPTFKKKKNKHLQYTYVNPIIRLNPEDLPSEKEIMKELGLKTKPILVMLGGSNFGTKLAEQVNRLAPKSKENFIIFGGNLNINFHKNVQYISFTADFFKYLKVCKGIITLAGQETLSEALVYKKPILCFPIEDHIEQVLNAYSLRDTIQISHKHTPKAIEEEIKKFIINIPNLELKVKKLNITANGSEQIAKLIELITEEI